MHRSALNAEVQYKLKTQELERHRSPGVEKEAGQPSFVSRLLAFLKRERRDDASPSPGRQPLDVQRRFAEKSAIK